MPVNSVQFAQAPWLYINGLQISNDATTPNSLLDIALGNCLDSTGVYQINLSAAVKINSANNGLNGLDTGAIAASKVYAVHVVADPVSGNAAGAMISLSATAPLLPYGYSVFRLIGYVQTDGSKNFIAAYWQDVDSSQRLYWLDAPIKVKNAGADASYTGIDLSAYIPAINNLPIYIYADFNANAANDDVKLKGYNQVGDGVIIIAPVAGATAHTTQSNLVLAQLNSGAPSIKYLASAGAVDLYLKGYQLSL